MGEASLVYNTDTVSGREQPFSTSASSYSTSLLRDSLIKRTDKNNTDLYNITLKTSLNPKTVSASYYCRCCSQHLTFTASGRKVKVQTEHSEISGKQSFNIIYQHNDLIMLSFRKFLLSELPIIIKMFAVARNWHNKVSEFKEFGFT